MQNRCKITIVFTLNARYNRYRCRFVFSLHGEKFLLYINSSAVAVLFGTCIALKFFSGDTHTIYPPTTEFKLDDSFYFPQGGNFALSDQITVVLANNPGQFTQNEVYKMRIGTRYTYPPRQFTTSSVYLTNLYLSQNTYWALQDVKTGEMVVDFDENFGAGAENYLGDEYIFITDLLKKGGQAIFLPLTIAIHPEESSGSRWGTESDLRARSIVFQRVFGVTAPLIRTAFYLKNFQKFPGTKYLFKFIFGKL